MATKSKKDKEKAKKSKTKQMQNMAHAVEKMKSLLEIYDAQCQKYNTVVYNSLKKQIKQSIDESKLLCRFLFDPTDRTTTYFWEDEMLPDIFSTEITVKKKRKKETFQNLVKILPLLESIKMVRFVYIQELLVWGTLIDHGEMHALAYLLNRKIYQLVKLELIDCFIDSKSLKILAPTVNKCYTLRELILDCNEFGDEGCEALCDELIKSTYLYVLSLNNCALTKMSGNSLGDMIANSTIRELFLNDNYLENEGVIALIGNIISAIKDDSVPILENKVKSFGNDPFGSKSDLLSERKSITELVGNENVEIEAPVKKKKKKSKASKASKVIPLPLGPEICKLGLANNRIGRFGFWQNFTPILCMQQLKKLICVCKELEEIDIFGNDISDIAARQILEGLIERKTNKYPQIGIRMCHLLNQDMFEMITKLAPGAKKKKKNSKKTQVK